MAWSAEQINNARIITAVGRKMGASDRDIQIALMTALQESTLRNLKHGDRDSQGLFQQRPSQGWGTVAQVTTPEYAARKFFEGLLANKNRNNISKNDAAQAVQRSGFPLAYGKWEDEAAGIMGLAGKGKAKGVDPLSSAHEKLTGRKPTPAELERWGAVSTGATLRPGSRGESVKNLQAFLAARGYDPGPIDGVYGPQTAAAVVALQRNNGIRPTGVLDPATQAKVGSVTGKTSASPKKTEPRGLLPKGPLPKMKTATPSSSGSTSTLRSGSSGSSVKALQQFLASRGYNPGPIDGVYGSRTAAAVKALQAKNGLKADGVVGPLTWAKIKSVSAPKKPTSSSSTKPNPTSTPTKKPVAAPKPSPSPKPTTPKAPMIPVKGPR